MLPAMVTPIDLWLRRTLIRSVILTHSSLCTLCFLVRFVTEYGDTKCTKDHNGHNDELALLLFSK
jgi:hypothetical protein